MTATAPRVEWAHVFKAEKPAPKSAGYGDRARVRVTAGLHHLQGNARPYFSVTADVFIPGRHDIEAGGCLHELVVELWPELAPVVALHLSDDSGAPMYAEANGWYWLSGALGGMGERYHGGNSEPARTLAECLAIFAGHCRISPEEAERIKGAVAAPTGLTAVAAGPLLVPAPVTRETARARWGAICGAMVTRWERETREAVELLDRLAGGNFDGSGRRMLTAEERELNEGLTSRGSGADCARGGQ